MTTQRLSILLVLLAACNSAPLRESEPRGGRLPDDVEPTLYALALDVDLHNAKLSGEVAITTLLRAPRKTIWLHARDLKIEAVRLTNEKGVAISAAFEQIGDTLHVVLADWLQPQSIVISISYERDIPQGALIAELGPMNARAWLPCFDEPRFKTPFDITITAPTEATVVTASRPRHVDKGRWEHERTPPLSVHLLTFVVGDFDVVESGRVRGIALRGGGEGMRYLLSQATPILEELERYFGTPYPFDKLDIVAAPKLSTGALENVGAIAIRDDIARIDPNDEEARRNAVETLAHELAHSWFGNLVTMASWEDVWLSESFASWMGRRVTQAVDPAFGADADRVEAALGAMQRDGLSFIHPVRHHVAARDDLRLDPITYGKGMAIIAMVENFMGDEPFRNAVRRYIDGHRFATATTDDFLGALENAEAAAIVRSFIDQPGVPWVSATVACPNITLAQERFVPLGGPKPQPQTWTIPVCASKQCWLLDTPSATFPFQSCTQAPMLNRGARGYYRFDRPSSHSGLSEAEALAVADSLAAATQAGKTSAHAFLAALPKLATRHERRLDHRIMETIRLIRDHHLDAANRPALEAYARRLFNDRPHGLNAVADETPSARLARIGMAYFLLEVGNDKQLRAEAIKRGHDAGALQRDPLMDRDLKALCLAIAGNDPRYTRDPDTAKLALEHADNGVIDAMLKRYLTQAETREVAKAYIGHSGHKYPVEITEGMCTDEDATWVREQFPPSERATVEAIETIELCAALDRAHHAAINDYFSSLERQH